MLFRQRQQTVIFVLGFVMVGAFVAFRYFPLKQKLNTVRGQLKRTQNNIALVSGRQKLFLALEEKLLKLQETVGNFDKTIPTERALGQFLQKIADVMDSHKLGEQLIQPGREVEDEEVNCIPIEMQCKGHLAQIFEFYKSLPNLDRIVRLEQVELKNSDDLDGQVSMYMKAVIYYRPQKEKS